jgi:hypothetical protein
MEIEEVNIVLELREKKKGMARVVAIAFILFE